MKRTKKNLYFSSEFTFYDLYNIDRVTEKNYVRDYTINVLSECDFEHEENRISVMCLLDDISVNVIDGQLENTQHEFRNFRNTLLRMLCLESFCKKEADHDKRVLKVYMEKKVIFMITWNLLKKMVLIFRKFSF